VSETVAALCRGGSSAFEDAGEHALKGVREPRRLYRAVSG
jgi:class 3 adenylate cyclase